MIAILDAVVSALRTGPKALTIPVCTDKNCNVEPEGRPPPTAPEVYISVDENRVESDPESRASGGDIVEVNYLDIWISLRIGIRARDRYADIYRRNDKGMQKIERQILAAIHGQQQVRIDASMNNDGQIEYLNPLFYLGRPRTEIKGAEWSNELSTDNVKGWLVRRLPFGGCRRCLDVNAIT